jgi:two-component sensor histidine kinase
MSAAAGDIPGLEFLAEPAFVVDRAGIVAGTNAAGRRLVGEDATGRSLFDRIEGSRAEFEEFLRRASRSTAPLVGGLTLAGADGPVAFRVSGARLGGKGPVRLVLRCAQVRDDQFALLSRRVRELDSALSKRMQEKAALEEALRQNQTLLRELQHRVKNNIQLMMSLIRMSANGREGTEAAAIVETARLRLQAMASTQEAIYRSATAGSVSARPFLEELIEGIGAGSGFGDRIALEIADAELCNEDAHCLALVVNELVTNAGKHGLVNGNGTIRVTFGYCPEGLKLVVQDDGPGLPEVEAARWSGLQLVRGLCRQIGASFEIRNEGGARCSVLISDRHGETRDG